MAGRRKQAIEQRLMRRIVDGLAGWATFHQACNINDHYDESAFYAAIKDIGRGRGFKVIPQAPLVRSVGKRGAPDTVDFVIHRTAGVSSKHPSLVFLEVKYLRGERPSQDLSYLRGDIDKLRPSEAADFECAAQMDHLGRRRSFC